MWKGIPNVIQVTLKQGDIAMQTVHTRLNEYVSKEYHEEVASFIEDLDLRLVSINVDNAIQREHNLIT